MRPFANFKETRLGRELVRGEHHPLLILVGAILAEAIAGVLLVWLTGGWDTFASRLHFHNVPWFALCLGAEAVAYLGYMLAFREVVVVEGGPRVPAATAAAIVSAGFAPVFMADTWGGFSVDRAALQEMGLDKDEAVARVVAMNGLEYAILAPAACVSAILVFFHIGGSAPASVTLPWLLVIPGLLAAALITNSRPKKTLARSRRHDGVRRLLMQAVTGLSLLRVIVTHPRKHGLGLAGAALYWAADITVLWSALHVFDIDLPVPALVLAYATGYALTRRALPAGGPGAVEGLLPLALSSVHVAFPPAIVAVFAYRFFNFWLALIPGAIVFRRLKQVEGTLKDAARAAT